MKAKSTLRRFFVIVAIVLGCTLVILSLATLVAADPGTPTVDGRWYGDGDYNNYALLEDTGRGELYYNRVGNTLYLAVVVSNTVNDNVFGTKKDDGPYMASAGWNAVHVADRLIGSDHVQLTLQCGANSWTWNHGYLYDADGDEVPNEADWLSGPGDNSIGGGTPPPGLVSASSLQWNLNNAATYSNTTWAWDVTLGGNRSGSGNWKSPDDQEWPPLDNDVTTNQDYPTYDTTHHWEWAMVYEMSIDVSICGNNVITITVPSAHNSPSKDGDRDVPICPDGCPLLGSIGDWLWDDGPSPNHVQDGTETGLNNIHVYLYEDEDGDGVIDAEDNLLQTTTTAIDPDTGKDGWYLFTDLPASNYIVKVDDADMASLYGLSPVNQYVDGDPAKDSNGPTSTPWTESVILAAGEDDLTIDFGYTSNPTAVTLSSFAARSSAGGLANWLWLGLVGLPVLAAGSFFWVKRRAG